MSPAVIVAVSAVVFLPLGAAVKVAVDRDVHFPPLPAVVRTAAAVAAAHLSRTVAAAIAAATTRVHLLLLHRDQTKAVAR
ncbi:hypothetical protein ACIQXD_04885 [Streptomyces uncialis]|uniref:hypothetical protein n=1 Tax=Streptomyces uncialis TaxID=1048205 RepID=UPI00382D6B6A